MDIKPLVVSPIITSSWSWRWSGIFLLLIELTGNIFHVNLSVSASAYTSMGTGTAGTASDGRVYMSHKSSKFKCPSDPLTERYPDPSSTSCTTYFLCHLGHAYPRRCGFRLAFHPTLKGCYPRTHMPEGACTPPQECEGTGRSAHPDDCTRYSICYYGRLFQYACIHDYIFDGKADHCVLNQRKAEECVKSRRLQILPNPDHPSFWQSTA